MEKRECYIVQSGDTLRGIAARFLGNEDAYKVLWAINRRRLAGYTPDEIYPGEIIVLPPKCEPVEPKPFSPWPWKLRNICGFFIVQDEWGHDLFTFANSHLSERNAEIVMTALKHFHASDRFPLR